jgi:hypothetical protein
MTSLECIRNVTAAPGGPVHSPIRIGSYDFVHVCRIKPQTDSAGAVAAYMPQSLFRNEKRLALNKYGSGPFCKFKISNSFRSSGVYALQLEQDIHYVGECRDLSARYNMGYGNISPRNCFKGGQETNCRLNSLIYSATRAGRQVSLWFHQTPNHKVAEHELLSLNQWRWNLG